MCRSPIEASVEILERDQVPFNTIATGYTNDHLEPAWSEQLEALALSDTQQAPQASAGAVSSAANKWVHHAKIHLSLKRLMSAATV